MPKNYALLNMHQDTESNSESCDYPIAMCTVCRQYISLERCIIFATSYKLTYANNSQSWISFAVHITLSNMLGRSRKITHTQKITVREKERKKKLVQLGNIYPISSFCHVSSFGVYYFSIFFVLFGSWFYTFSLFSEKSFITAWAFSYTHTHTHMLHIVLFHR